MNDVIDRGENKKKMSEEEIMNLTLEDFRELSPQEKQQDDFRRMFQMLGLIYQNQIEIKNMLLTNKNSQQT